MDALFLAKSCDLNLELCLESGQTFSWQRVEGKKEWYVSRFFTIYF